MNRAHLICLREPHEKARKAIREVWPVDGKDRIELNETTFLVSHTNGGVSVYDLIADRVAEDEFTALVVRIGKAHHGYESRSLWLWLRERMPGDA